MNRVKQCLLDQMEDLGGERVHIHVDEISCVEEQDRKRKSKNVTVVRKLGSCLMAAST